MGQASFRDVVNAIAFATAPRQIGSSSPIQMSRRLSPSAGALHAIEMLLIRPAQRPQVFRYDPWKHELQRLAASPDGLRRMLEIVAEILPGARGDVLIFAGDILKIEAVYDHPESLLWRDSGALLQTIYLVGTALNLAVCATGALGGAAIEAIGVGDQLMACGVLLLGSHTQFKDTGPSRRVESGSHRI